MNLDLKGKRALVGGSTQGIGKASAIELAQLGYESGFKREKSACWRQHTRNR